MKVFGRNQDKDTDNVEKTDISYNYRIAWIAGLTHSMTEFLSNQ